STYLPRLHLHPRGKSQFLGLQWDSRHLKSHKVLGSRGHVVSHYFTPEYLNNHYTPSPSALPFLRLICL
ncbi:uncharacterized protein CLUP02_08167, partial [Colletotrichum lupini]